MGKKNKKNIGSGLPPPRQSGDLATTTTRTPATFLWWIFGLNFIPLMFNFGSTLMYMIMAVLAIYLPANYFKGSDK